MSARVLNPMLMSDMSRGVKQLGGRVVPTKAELAPIRRDLFGPVDHAANRALVERELRAQSRLDAERWGFDFQLGIPRSDDHRYAWEIVRPNDVVPEPYALRGMPYIRKHAPATPRKMKISGRTNPAINQKSNDEDEKTRNVDGIDVVNVKPRNAEMTPPQELRVPDICNRNGEITPDDLIPRDNNDHDVTEDPTTPILPLSARKQSAITDFMKSRKRSLKGSSKSMLEPPEKINRNNTGKIRS